MQETQPNPAHSQPEVNRCSYSDDYGSCLDPHHSDGFCLWHHPELERDDPQLKSKLEARAATGRPMTGFRLRGANLEGINLVNRNGSGYNLSASDLSRANLRSAHCFMLNLHSASLLKADLCGANLHCADVRQANLLGAKLDGARLEHTTMGDRLIQETQGTQAQKNGDRDTATDYFEQAEEVYRNLRLVSERQGLFENAGHLFRREMIMRRNQMPPFSVQRTASKLVDLFCGYGEQPLRVIGFSLIVILCCAVVYFFGGIQGPDGEIIMSTGAGLGANAHAFLDCVYFSVITFTTLGYGDLTPIGLIRLPAACEAFVGSFTMALFVVVFVKKMTR